MSNFELNIQGRRSCFHGPQVMGIVNVTPDSFWEGSRMGQDADRIRRRVSQVLEEGGTLLDVGAYSTRPGAPEVDEQEELDRLSSALRIVREEAGHDVPVSVDTFRAGVAETCIRELGADIINDISGGTLDERMFQVVAQTGAPYILMHMRGTPQTMQQQTDYPDGVTAAVVRFFNDQLQALGRQFDIEAGRRIDYARPNVILDPGFGFAKTLQQNYELMHDLPCLLKHFPENPLLVGISRKSMIYRLFDTDPSRALNGTTVLNTFALQCGAHILRVHDVREAVEAVRMIDLLTSNK